MPEIPDAQCVMPLGEANARSIVHQLAVKIGGSGEPECAQQEQLPGCRLQQIFSAHYLGDAHGGIIDYDCQLIGWNIITPPDEKIAEIFSGEVALFSQIQVRED